MSKVPNKVPKHKEVLCRQPEESSKCPLRPKLGVIGISKEIISLSSLFLSLSVSLCGILNSPAATGQEVVSVERERCRERERSLN